MATLSTDAGLVVVDSRRKGVEVATPLFCAFNMIAVAIGVMRVDIKRSRFDKWIY
jgi:hypothetical protein